MRASRVSILALAASVPACKSRFTLPPDARNATQVAVGDGFACTRMKDGSARCWGKGEAGQLGEADAGADGTTHVALNTRVDRVATGGRHACAVTESGVWCWGANDWGQVDGKRGPTGTTPVRIPDSARFVELALGARHTCARTDAGDVTCWGADEAGQLAVPGNDAAPRAVPGVKAKAIAAGGDATCVVTDDGGVTCWGRFPGRTDDMPEGPVRVAGIAHVRSLAVGRSHACAALEDGSVWCWGDDDEGQLGDGAFAARAKPAAVPGLTGAVRVVVGRAHTCALMHDATVFCWGANDASQLADGTNAHRASPVLIAGLVEIAELAAGGDATCARYGNGTERCWGALLLPKAGTSRINVPMDIRW
jgi:alpha-tubulin suppressor-like RCC1 family protein